MKARSFPSNRKSTACGARPARKTSARSDARRFGIATDVLESLNRSVRLVDAREMRTEARRRKPAGFFVAARKAFRLAAAKRQTKFRPEIRVGACGPHAKLARVAAILVMFFERRE